MKAIQVKEVADAVNGMVYGQGDAFITSVCIDSKEVTEGALFVPIIGARVDAHTFIDNAFLSGAVCVFTSREVEEAKRRTEKGSYIKVENTIEALQKLGAYFRNQVSYPIVGITGSVGKTTTKEMIAAALSQERRVIKTIGNKNSQIGLPLMMLHLDSDYDIGIIEMGMSEPNEMRRLVQVARPEIAVVTNIGVSHIADLGSQENIRKEKLNIINEFVRDQRNPEKLGTLFINGDDMLLCELKQIQKDLQSGGLDSELLSKETCEVMKNVVIKTYGFGSTCDYKAKQIHQEGNKMYFTYISADKEEEIMLSVLGEHNVRNALIALAIAEYYGIELRAAKKGLMEYKPIAMRGQIKEKGSMKIIDETYNASPDSMISTMKVLSKIQGVKRKIAVLADALDLGEISYQCHYDVGVFMGKLATKENKIDELITIGQEAKAIVIGLQSVNAKILTHSFDKNEEAIEYLKDMQKDNTAILVKGSRGMHTDEIVNALLLES